MGPSVDVTGLLAALARVVDPGQAHALRVARGAHVAARAMNG